MTPQLQFLKKIINLALVLSCILYFSPKAAAQHNPHYSLFMFNKLAINPAYAGSKEALSIAALYRYQWLNAVGGPQTANINAHTPLLGNRVGAGIRLVNDQIGLVNTTYANMAYAYRLSLKNGSVLSAGIGLEFDHGRYDWTKAEPLEANVHDPNLPMDEQARSTFNVGFGLYYTTPKFYIGLSMPQILRNSLYESSIIEQASIENLRSYYLMAGLSLPLGNKVSFRPSVLATYVPNAPFDVDVNLSVVFLNRFWVGATYRLHDSADAVFQVKVNQQWTIGLAVDLTLSELTAATPGSGEIMIEYVFDYSNDKLNNIRFFD